MKKRFACLAILFCLVAIAFDLKGDGTGSAVAGVTAILMGMLASGLIERVAWVIFNKIEEVA